MHAENTIKKRFAPPTGCKPAGIGISLALTAVSAILAGAFPSGYGGVAFLIVAAGLFAYVLCASFSFVYIAIGAVASVLIAMLCGVKLPLALIALIYIPVALAISESVRRRATLTVTVSVATAVLLACLGIAAGICYLTSGNALVEAIQNVVNDVFASLESYVDRLNAAAAAKDPDKTLYTENFVEALKNAVFMLFPSVAVLVCMLVAYLSAKVFRLATIVGDSNEMFFGGSWPIAASFAGSVVFLVSYIVSMFAFNSEIVYYSATNIMYIVMPSQAIVGIRLLLGHGGLLRSGKMRGAKWMGIILCIYFILINPIMLLMLASMFTAFYNIRIWLLIKKKNKEENDD